MTIEKAREVINNTRGDMYIKELFDPVQTHAAYNVPEYSVDHLKVSLKDAGASRFRVVKTGIEGIKILCFKVKK